MTIDPTIPSPASLTIIEFDGDWAGLFDTGTGQLLDEGHCDDLRRTTLERIGVTIDYVPERDRGFEFVRGRLPVGLTLSDVEKKS